jgi:hypothetical protein
MASSDPILYRTGAPTGALDGGEQDFSPVACAAQLRALK